ncbi:MAG: PH domain-containing protein [Lachnospiraceae bacterium]|jgi:membrane protein YdbS with pleckstrin-like domain|nr:PH domain-containing protein [Lachnospiraceae bacterium]
MVFEKLNKNALKCMYTATGAGVLISMAILTGLMWYFSLFSNALLADVYLFAMLLLAANAVISPPFRYKRYRYAIDDTCIDLREGYLWTEEHIVPLNRLHQISMNQGPIDRMYGLTKVVVTTAGGEVTIRFLEYQRAQKIADALTAKINDLALLSQNGGHHE